MPAADQLTATRLVSARLALEPLTPEDADELAPLLDDACLHRFIGGQPAALPQLRARFERQGRGWSPDGTQRWLNWVVRERDTGDAVGTAQATVTESVAELAWVVGSAHQGRGIAKEAAGLIASWLREQGVGHLRAHVHPDHQASIAVARSIGLQPTQVIVDGEVRWES